MGIVVTNVKERKVKKLFEVEARYYVMAEDTLEAKHINPRDIDACSVYAVEAKMGEIDSRWVNAIPFNSDDDRTCGEIVRN